MNPSLPSLLLILVWFLPLNYGYGQDPPSSDEPEIQSFQTLSLAEKVDKLAEASLLLDEQQQLIGNIYQDTNTMWVCIAAFLVMFMQAGFAMLEAGFVRAKNVVNILMKNLMDFSFSTIAFWMFGFGIMFGTGATPFLSGWFGWSDFLYSTEDNSLYAFLLFQTVFAGTAATIVSGAMAERTKFSAYVWYSMAISIIVYPVFGHWAWGSFLHGDVAAGWLETSFLGLPGFHDFAGSTVVHSLGGWAGLAGALILGPRSGKFSKGRIFPIPGHNVPYAMLGCFILWLGWFGFNPGSTLLINQGEIAKIAVTTNLAAAAGATAGVFVSWQRFGKPDPSFAINGALAGLVAITAGCNVVSPGGALIIGALAGTIVVFSCTFWEWIGVDDPVGAISVHGVCGAWGTFAVGLFSTQSGMFYGHGLGQLAMQLVGILSAFAWSFGVSWILFQMIHRQIGLRASQQAEVEGMDIHEHGMQAYPTYVDPISGQTQSHQPMSGSSMPPSRVPQQLPH